MALPLPLLPWLTPPYCQFTADGWVPLTGGSLTFYVYNDLDTLQDTYSDQQGNVVNENPLGINAQGWPTSSDTEVPIFLQRTGYTVVLKDADGVTVRTFDYVADAASVAQAQASERIATATEVSSLPYVVTADDEALYVTTTGAGSVFLPATRDRTLIVKNKSNFVVTLVPSGSSTIEGQSSYTLPVQTGSNHFPTYVLDFDRVSNWQVTAGLYEVA